MKIVVDTNVIASAIFFGGKPRMLIDILMSNQIEAYVTNDIIMEYKETIAYLQNKYAKIPVLVPLAAIIESMKVIEPITSVTVCRDSDDNKFIGCAVDAKCLFIVSGDKDLLDLHEYGDIKIITVSEFITRFYKN